MRFTQTTIQVVLCCLIIPLLAIPLTFPKNQLEHFKQRDELKKAERKYEHRDWAFSKDEKIVDQYLSYLKWKEFKNTVDLDFPPSKPIEKILNKIVTSELYQVLADLPKGGILHSHEDHQLSKKTLFDIIWSSKDFDHLYIIPPNATDNAWKMDFFVNPPTDKPWIKVKNSSLTMKNILKQNTLIGLLAANVSNNPTDSNLRWKTINPLWDRASVQLISNINIKKKYITAMLEHCYSEGVTYVESRKGFGLYQPLYALDHSGQSSQSNGKKFFDMNYEINLTIGLVKKFASTHPRFIGHKWISYVSRTMNREMFQSVLETVVKLHEQYPHSIIGFDAVGEEDAGHSSMYYINEYLSLYENGKSTIPLYLHSVETSWPEDLMTSKFQDDIVSTLENSYETIIFQSKRIGHGKGFVKKPYLKKILREQKIAVEICVISNQILGLDADIRNHYGQILYKEGVPIVLAPDDPGTFGYDNTTVDWYSAYLSWGLNLGDLKQIALNSIAYSGMTDNEKKDAISTKWQPSWNEYVDKVKAMACRRNFSYDASLKGTHVSFNRLIPNFGFEGTVVHIFGNNFESAICKVPKCKFGFNLEVEAEYMSNGHLSCMAPICSGCPVNFTLPIHVALDEFSFEYTGLYFTYF